MADWQSLDPEAAREAEKYDNPIPSRELILQHLSERGSPAAREELVAEFGLTTDEQLEALRRGVPLNDGPTLPAQARRIEAPSLWPRDPPVRFRKTVPDAWIELTLREGRNRQVRRMTAAVGLPTLRLVRVAIGGHRLDGLAPGAWRECR